MVSVKNMYYTALFYIKRHPKISLFSFSVMIILMLVTIVLIPLKRNLDFKKERYSTLLLALPQEQVPRAAKVDYRDVLKQETAVLEELRANFFSVNDATLFLISILGKWCDDLSITMKKMVQGDNSLFLKDDVLIPVELHLEGKYKNLMKFLRDLEAFEQDIFLSKLDVVRTDDKDTLLYMILHFQLPVRGD